MKFVRACRYKWLVGYC